MRRAARRVAAVAARHGALPTLAAALMLALSPSEGRAAAQPPPASIECAALADSARPVTAAGRAQLLARLEDRRESCIDHAPFLALLGTLWLEQGDASQAQLWLERSLMLDPQSPVTLAEHALALAALGDRTAVGELLQRWRDRADVPLLLRARLELAQRGPVPVQGLRTARGPTARGFTWRRSVELMRGYETNLDHSPRLSEITLSSPDGSVDLPLVNPIVPRKGQAWTGEVTIHGIFSTGLGVDWQGGLRASGRHSADEPDTDTRQLQFEFARWQQHEGWRSHVQAALQRVSGPLNEPFNTYTLGLAGEREWNGCGSRLGLDSEWRRQDRSRIVDSLTVALQGGINCRFKALPNWAGSMALRIGWDRPREAERPGGVQQQTSVGLRAAGLLGAGFRAEVAVRATRLADREGYSPILQNNARRRQNQHQYSLEVSRPLPALGVSGVDLVLQLQHLRQTSNLQLFNQTGRTAFAGLRADW